MIKVTLNVIIDAGFERNIIVENRKIEEFNLQIEALSDRIETIKKGMGGINYAIESAFTVKKQIKILENRLHKVTLKISK